MRQVEFGNTGMRVSEIGFGGSRIGGVFAGSEGKREALRLLAASLDAGITFYDTADLYSKGESESLIGAGFRGRRSEVILATKGGYCMPARRSLVQHLKPLLRPVVQALGLKRARMPAALSGSLSQDFSPRYLTAALEGSLRRLGTDHVDLYQLHSPTPAFAATDTFGDALEALDRMKTQGKIRFYGIATETPEDAPSCLGAPGISSLQIGFGLLDLESLDTGTLAAASARGLGIIARGCYGGGLMKDGLDEPRLREMTPKWERILALRAYSESQGRPLLESALQFCRSTPAVSVTLLGMHRRNHLEDSLRHLAGKPLDQDEYAALRKIGAGARH